MVAGAGSSTAATAPLPPYRHNKLLDPGASPGSPGTRNSSLELDSFETLDWVQSAATPRSNPTPRNSLDQSAIEGGRKSANCDSSRYHFVARECKCPLKGTDYSSERRCTLACNLSIYLGCWARQSIPQPIRGANGRRHDREAERGEALEAQERAAGPDAAESVAAAGRPRPQGCEPARQRLERSRLHFLFKVAGTVTAASALWLPKIAV